MFRKFALGAVAGLALTSAAFAAGATQDIVEIASGNDDFDTLVAAVSAAELAETLKSDGPFTVFAPTDAAFEALPDGTLEELLKPENKAQLVSILSYHVVPGKMMSSDLVDGTKSTTVQGSDVTVSINGSAMVNDAHVIQADIEAENGIIHVIDKVIMPQN